MTREEVLDAVYDEVTAKDTCVEDAVVSLLEKIVRLREQLAEVERERENVSSQLWDCTNERDGYKHRAERMERVVEAADAFFDARTVPEEWECRSKMMVALTEYRALDAEAQP